jgi:hypothetical protein
MAVGTYDQQIVIAEIVVNLMFSLRMPSFGDQQYVTPHLRDFPAGNNITHIEEIPRPVSYHWQMDSD